LPERTELLTHTKTRGEHSSKNFCFHADKIFIEMETADSLWKYKLNKGTQNETVLASIFRFPAPFSTTRHSKGNR